MYAHNSLATPEKFLTIAVQSSILTITNTPNDQWLFQQIAQGDEQAFETIFHRFTPKLKPFVLGIVKVTSVADEIVQDVFLKLWLNRENLNFVNEPSAWLYRVASNAALNQLKKQANEYKHLKNIIAGQGKNPNDILEQLSAKQLQQLIYEAVANLPEKRRQIYLLTREEGLSHKEIAETMNISVNTVKNQVVHALKSIQEHILSNTGVYIPLILLSAEINFVLA